MNDPTPINDCVAVSELLPELALGTLSGTERADVLAHLDRCGACREKSADWAAMVDVFPTLLGEAEPPAGFEARTLERLKADRGKVTRRPARAARARGRRDRRGRSDRQRRRGSDHRRPRRLGVVGYGRRVGEHGRQRRPLAGDAFMTSGRDRYVFVDVDYGVKTGMYRIEAVDAKDRVTALGHLAVSGGHGAWAGEVPASGGTGALAMVRLVDPSGAVLCRRGSRRPDPAAPVSAQSAVEPGSNRSVKKASTWSSASRVG